MGIDALKQIWPEWQIEGKPLGKGSYGVVYKAVRRDHNVESYAAIKSISIPSDPSELDSLRSEGLDINASRTYLQGIVNDFVSEIQLMESLKGVQNIVNVEDYKVVEKTEGIGWDIYIRMELLTPFNTYASGRKLTEGEVIKLGCDICTALEICSQRNVIHRDIKPENIFINDFGHFKLGDFGIARKMENVTGGLSQKGTFNYMAPEVATSNNYDARVDTYSLGIVLYRLLNGNRLPFLDNEQQLMNPNERRNAVDRRIRGEALPAPCDASPAMAGLILRACAYNPNMRFASATEMKQALMSVAYGTQQAAAAVNLDATTSVRRAPAAPNPQPGRPVNAVPNQQPGRPVSAPPNPQPRQPVNTFGAAPKKKSKLPVIAALGLGAVVLVAAVIFAASSLMNHNGDSGDTSEASGKPTAETADYSKFDEEQIAAIISEAEALVDTEDYEGALVKIKTALVTYPKSKALQDKEQEYTDALEAKIKEVKEKTLEEASNLAESGEYASAMALLKSAQETAGEDPDYENAYNNYRAAYKDETVGAAAKLADRGDYPGAIQSLNAAMLVIGEDAELSNKIQSYKSAYETEVVSKANQLLEAEKYDEAIAALNEGLAELPNSAALTGKKSEAERLKAAAESTPGSGGNEEQPGGQEPSQPGDQNPSQPGGQEPNQPDEQNPNQSPVLPDDGDEFNISGGASRADAVEIQRENLYHATFADSSQTVDWYCFTTSENYSAYSMEILNNSIDTTVYLTLYDVYENELKKQSVSKGSTSYLDIELESDTTYWIAVTRYSNSRTGNYQFSIKEKIRYAGTGKSSAFNVSLNSKKTKEFDVRGINDWYKFQTTQNYSTYQFTLTNNSVDTTVYLTVYDEYDTQLGQVTASKGSTSILDLKLTAGKEYTVCFSRYYSDRNGYYQFTVSEMVCDSGLTKDEAFPLAVNEAYHGSADTSFEEWYVYDFPEDSEYKLQLTNNSINTTLYATVYDVLGTELGKISASNGSSASKSMEVAAGTTLYVKITRYNMKTFGNYTINVTKN